MRIEGLISYQDESYVIRDCKHDRGMSCSWARSSRLCYAASGKP